MKVIRAFYVVASVLALVGLWYRIVPTRTPATPRGSVGVPLVAPRTAVPGDDAPAAAYAPIETANIFSRARSAPGRLAAAGDAKSRPHSTKPSAPTLTLLGTTIGPGGAVALIEANPTSEGAQVHHMGDVVEGARLVDITDSTVTLDRPSGPLVLHLQNSQHKKL
jgi:hypothetical protein